MKSKAAGFGAVWGAGKCVAAGARSEAKKKVKRSRTTGCSVWRYTGASGFLSSAQLFRVGLHWGYIGLMENKIETTI